MVLKIFKGVWFFSLLGLLITFFYVYAGLPETVNLWEEEVSISRNGLFYLSIVLIALVNVMVFLARNLIGKQNEGFTSWFYGLIISINVFFIASLGLLNVFNGGDRYDYSRMAPVIYGSLILICTWIISWPVYLFSQKILSK
ncbi:MAG: hypothetical protein ABL895_20165 [Cyclobacteriaceae bacterium]